MNDEIRMMKKIINRRIKFANSKMPFLRGNAVSEGAAEGKMGETRKHQSELKFKQPYNQTHLPFCFTSFIQQFPHGS